MVLYTPPLSRSLNSPEKTRPRHLHPFDNPAPQPTDSTAASHRMDEPDPCYSDGEDNPSLHLSSLPADANALVESSTHPSPSQQSLLSISRARWGQGLARKVDLKKVQQEALERKEAAAAAAQAAAAAAEPPAAVESSTKKLPSPTTITQEKKDRKTDLPTADNAGSKTSSAALYVMAGRDRKKRDRVRERTNEKGPKDEREEEVRKKKGFREKERKDEKEKESKKGKNTDGSGKNTYNDVEGLKKEDDRKEGKGKERGTEEEESGIKTHNKEIREEASSSSNTILQKKIPKIMCRR